MNIIQNLSLAKDQPIFKSAAFISLVFLVFYFTSGFQKVSAQSDSALTTTISITPSNASPTCIPTVIRVATSFHDGYTKGNFYVIRNQEEWEKYVNYKNGEIAPISFDKQMLVVFPFTTPPGEGSVHIQVSSACILADHIQIDYSIVGYRHPKYPNKSFNYRSIGVVLPQSDLAVVASNLNLSESFEFLATERNMVFEI
jgi:hypothetical protein